MKEETASTRQKTLRQREREQAAKRREDEDARESFALSGGPRPSRVACPLPGEIDALLWQPWPRV